MTAHINHSHDHSHSFLEGHDHCDVLHLEESLPCAALVAPQNPCTTTKPAPSSSSSKKKKSRKYEQDNNFRAAVIHVVADAFVSLLVIAAISIAGNVPNTRFLDPLVAVIGAFVILSWAATLMYDTSMNLLDVAPDLKLNSALKR
jgi:Co/Zn/Cd efflux system component